MIQQIRPLSGANQPRTIGRWNIANFWYSLLQLEFDSLTKVWDWCNRTHNSISHLPQTILIIFDDSWNAVSWTIWGLLMWGRLLATPPLKASSHAVNQQIKLDKQSSKFGEQSTCDKPALSWASSIWHYRTIDVTSKVIDLMPGKHRRSYKYRRYRSPNHSILNFFWLILSYYHLIN